MLLSSPLLRHFPGSRSPDAVHVSCVLVTCLAVAKYPRKQLKEERVYSVLQFQRIQSITVVTAGWQKQEVTLYPQPETEDHRMLAALLPCSLFTTCSIALDELNLDNPSQARPETRRLFGDSSPVRLAININHHSMVNSSNCIQSWIIKQ